MKILLRQGAFIVLFSCLSASVASAQKEVAGYWKGVAVRQNAGLPLEIEFREDKTGVKGVITVRSLGGLEIPLKTVSYQSPNLKFELQTDAGNVVFNGLLNKNSLTGSWNLFGFESQVSLKRAAAKPKPYTQEEIRCQNGDVTLAGTLLLPKTKNRHPALVFLHGSGATKRDINRFLADNFARKGIAALIFDKRGTGNSTGDWRQSDFNDLARDAAACVEVIKNRKDINKRQIGLIGASQSGWVAPLAASISADVAFMINISGAFVPVAREGWWDAEFRLREKGFSESEIEKAIDLLKQNDEVTRTGKGLAELEAAVERAKSEPWFSLLDFGPPLSVNHPSRHWYRRVIDFDSLPVLQKLSIPSLWIYGGRDQTVPAMESAANLDKLKAQGKDITIKIFPTANHQMFVIPEANQPFRWFGYAPAYVETIEAWLSKRAIIKSKRKS